MTEEKTQTQPVSKKISARAFFTAAAKGLFLISLGFVMSVSKLPMDTYPLGIAVVCAAPSFPPAVLLGVALGGIFTKTALYTVASAAACMFRIAVHAIRGAKSVRKSGFYVIDGMGARITAALLGSAGASVYSYIQNGGVYVLLGAVFTVCAAVFSTVTFSFFLDKSYKYTSLFPVGAISVMICAGLPLKDIYIGNVSAALVFSAAATLLAAFFWGGAYGGVTGLLTGLALGGKTTAILALTGCAAGFFSAIGPFAAELTSMAVFIGGAMYVFGTTQPSAYIIPVCIAEALTAVPVSLGLIGRMSVDRSGAALCGGIITKLKDDENEKRMEMLSKAMRSLSQIMGGLTKKFRKKSNISFEAMCRAVWSRHCAECPVDCKCHDMGSIPGDDVIENLTQKLMITGRVDKERIGEYIASKCPKTDEIVGEINSGAAYIVDKLTGDERVDILSLDYEATSKMLSDALAQSSGRYEPDKIMSEKLRRALLRSGFATENLVVCGDRKLYIIATGDEILRSGVGADDIRAICENVCGRKFKTPSFRFESGRAAMLLEADSGYYTENAGRLSAKRGEEFCGDSVSVVENRDGFFYSFICDGMGSGEVAAATSKICRVFLEKMLEGGNSKTTAVEMLNTFVRNKGVECYATVDLLEVDLILGTASFLKCGAVPSYVKRGGNIFKIESGTFPVGIIREMSAEITEFDLCDGDVVIMCSDGVAQDFDVSASLDPSWFVGFIENEWTDDLSEMAQKIMTAASRQNHRSDDMTVELIRIRKKPDEEKKAS